MTTKSVRNGLVPTSVFSLLVATGLSLAAAEARADVSVQRGEQDFTDGEWVNFVGYSGVSIGEPAPFNSFQGSDFDPLQPLSASWTFNFAAANYASALLTIGITDHDSQAPGNQVAFFGVDGSDLTNLLNAQFESHGGRQAEYNVYSVAIPVASLVQLNDGTATFTLTLQGPGLGGLRLTATDTVPSNGAGLDFSRLTLIVPEPASGVMLATAAMISLTTCRRKSVPHNRV